MRALVTGGSGFIGSHLVNNLNLRGHKIFNYDWRSGHLVYDIRDLVSLRKVVASFKPEVVFHLAGILGTNELMECVREAEEINVVGTINVLDVCKEFNIPLVFTSKINPPDWLNPYTITKRTCEDYCKMYQEQWNLKICVLRLLYVYGPRQKPYPVQKYVPTFISRALNNQPIPIWGTGQQHVDPLFVSDAAEATMRAWRYKRWKRTIEVGLGKGVPVIEVAKRILEITGSKSKLKFLPMRDGEPLHSKHRLYADTMLMKKLLLMHPQNMVQLHEGLRYTVDWWKEK